MRFSTLSLFGLFVFCNSASSRYHYITTFGNDMSNDIYTYQTEDFRDKSIDLTPKKQGNDTTCHTKSQEEGICVKKSMCELKEEKTDPSTKFNLRTKDACGKFEMCCPQNKVRKVERHAAAFNDMGCGVSNPAAGFRGKSTDSLNGYADFAEFPWIVALIKSSAGSWSSESYLGGGSLINPSVVITVAHKVDFLEPFDLKCRAGEWDTGMETEIYAYEERGVKKIIVHEEFYRLHVHNDIALLILKEAFNKAPHINVACLTTTMPPPGTICYSMGWGQDFTKGNDNAARLKKVVLPLVAPDVCQHRYRNTRLGSTYRLHRSLTCAGGEASVDTCVGDGGSSLVCPIESPSEFRFAVVGMVAYGLDCGTENLPGVYVKVPVFYDWIGKQLTIEGHNKSAYVY